MPQFIAQPSNTLPSWHPVGNLDSLVYKVRSLGAEYITSSGTFPSVTIEYDGDAQTAGKTFTIFGQTFTVATGNSTATTANLTGGTALQQAERVRDAVLANVNLFPNIEFFLNASGSNWRLTLRWKTKVAFADVYSNGDLNNPYTIVSETLGAAPSYVDGFRIAYQFFTENNTGGAPVTDLRSVPPLSLNGSEQNIELDFTEVAAGLVRTTLPFSLSGTPTTDDTISKRVFLRAGSHVSAGGSTTWGTFTKSNVVNIINAAVKVDANKLLPYIFFGGGVLVKFLTARPAVWPVNRENSFEWMWFIGNVAEHFSIIGSGGLTDYKIRYTVYSESGGITLTNNTLAATDGVFVIPCGPSNLPPAIDLEGKTHYTIQIFANVFIDETPTFIEVSELRTFTLMERMPCAEPFSEVYFLEPLGGYATLPIHRVSVDVEQQYQTHEMPIDPDASVADKRTLYGLSTNSTKSWYKASVEIRLRYTKENFEYLSGLRSSPDLHLRYRPDADTSEVYKFIPDAGSMQVYQEDDYAIAELTGRVHPDLPVQKQPFISR